MKEGHRDFKRTIRKPIVVYLEKLWNCLIKIHRCPHYHFHSKENAVAFAVILGGETDEGCQPFDHEGYGSNCYK